MLPVKGKDGMGTPACSHTHVANSEHHSSHGPYGLQYWPRSGSLFTWLLAMVTMADVVAVGDALGGLVNP